MTLHSAFGNSLVYGKPLPCEQEWIPSVHLWSSEICSSGKANFLKETSYYKIQLLSWEPNYEAIALTRPEGILFLVSLMMLHAGKFRNILEEELYSNSFYSIYLSVLRINLSVSNIWSNSFIYTLIQNAVFFTKGKVANSTCLVEFLSSILKGIFFVVLTS